MVPSDVGEPGDGLGRWGSGNTRFTMNDRGLSEMILVMMSMIGLDLLRFVEPYG